AMAQRCLPDAGLTAVPVLRSALDEPGSLVRALAAVHTRGHAVDWAGQYAAAETVDLPTYPFERERFWVEAGREAPDPAAMGLVPLRHPLLGAAVQVADGGEVLLTGRLSLASHAWLADHAVAGTVVVPGAALAELALAAGAQVGMAALVELIL